MWNSILSVSTEFENCVRYRAHNGLRLKFWKDIWCGNSSLKHQFPSLFMVDTGKQSLIADKFQVLGGKVSWTFRFWRHLTDIEITNFAFFLHLLESTFLSW